MSAEQPPKMSRDLAELRHWEDFGGHWRLAETDSSRVALALLRCDGGEEVGWLASSEPDLVAYVTARVAESEGGE